MEEWTVFIAFGFNFAAVVLTVFLGGVAYLDLVSCILSLLIIVRHVSVFFAWMPSL